LAPDCLKKGNKKVQAMLPELLDKQTQVDAAYTDYNDDKLKSFTAIAVSAIKTQL
jgi:hypothetical protein